MPTPIGRVFAGHTLAADDDAPLSPSPADRCEHYAAAHSEAEPPEHQRTDLHQIAARDALAGSLSQVNEVSVEAGNYDDICGGACVLSALVASSTNTESWRANARALREAADACGAWNKLPLTVRRSEVDQALERLEHGTLTPHEAAQLQQLCYALGKSFDPRPAGGLTEYEMLALTAKLQAHGAKLQGTSLIQVGDRNEGHWVAAREGRLLNTLESTQVRPRHLSRKDPAWNAQVSVAEGSVKLENRTHCVWVDPSTLPADAPAINRQLMNTLRG